MHNSQYHDDENEWFHLDTYGSLDKSTHRHAMRRRNYSWSRQLFDMLEVPMVLLTIGISTACVTWIILAFESISDGFSFTLMGEIGDYKSLIFFVTFSVCMALGSNFVTQSVCPDAVGGGLPEIRTILSGTIKPILLSGRLIFAKIVGFCLARGAGLSVGVEGPHIHISCAIADKLMHLSMFERVGMNYGKRLELIACAAAAGVSATFGSSFGGLLFSVEITCTAYMVRNLPRAFLTATFSAVTLYLMGLSKQVLLFETPDFMPECDLTYQDIFLFIAIGVFCGLVGALFIAIVQIFVTTRNTLLDKSLSKDLVAQRRYYIVALGTLIVAALMYTENAIGFVDSNPQQLNVSNFGSFMFEKEDYGLTLSSLVIFFLFKAIVTSISVTLPLPVGLFTPVFLVGGILGRIIGAVVCAYIPTSFQPWEFAIIGAAAFSTGVTRAISTALIVYEIAGSTNLRLPLGISILCAYFVGNRLTKDIYSIIIEMNNTPFLVDLPPEIYPIPVAQVMTKVAGADILHLRSTYHDVKRILASHPQSEVFPVVYSVKSMVLVGAVLRSNLRRSLRRVDPQLIKFDSVKAEMELIGRHPSREELRIQKKKNLHLIDTGGEDEDEVTLPHRWSSFLDEEYLKSTKSQSARKGFVSSTNGSLSDWFISLFPGCIKNGRTDDDMILERSYHSIDSEDALSSIESNPLDAILPYVAIIEGRRRPVRESAEGVRLSEQDILIDLSPYQVVDTMHLIKLDSVFRMLKLNQAYVTKSGKLVGIISRGNLREYIGTYERKPLDRCSRLLTSCFNDFTLPCREYSRENGMDNPYQSVSVRSVISSPDSPIPAPFSFKKMYSTYKTATTNDESGIDVGNNYGTASSTASTARTGATIHSHGRGGGSQVAQQL